ncbi:MAG: thymidine phosphorylase [Holophagales bacterium]|nr:thymidine phosphorylase [Holophagales bacterium]MYG29218.1 thymidine phosphorylase [Holophagales bacterium]MYI81212.1 thymidine phosphorylase [Holophagales bacterium]
MATPFDILNRMREGRTLTAAEVRSVVDGAASGSWTDVQLAAFLMAAAMRGLDRDETRELTLAMLESGDQWALAKDFGHLVDKHSTGGVGDTVSLIALPLLASCGVPVAKLTGRSLGHSGGTADKLESIPGVRLELDRAGTLDLLDRFGMAIGIATAGIAPADKRLYGLRDRTSTVSSIPLVVGSILSKKLALGASGIVFDVKIGNGAFFPDARDTRSLASSLVEISAACGTPADYVLSDMNQPLGRWVGHAAEVREALDCLVGDGDPRLLEVVAAICRKAARLVGRELSRRDIDSAIGSGAARQKLVDWADAQGAEPGWADALDLAPVEAVVTASESGFLEAVDCRRIGNAFADACRPDREPHRIDHAVALRYDVRLGQQVERGQELARLYVRRDPEPLQREVAAALVIGEETEPPPAVME